MTHHIQRGSLARAIPLAILSAPSLVFGMLCLALFGVLGMVTCLRVGKSGAWSIDATWRPWVAMRWRYSTTLGLSVIYHPLHLATPARAEELQRHESVHVRQHQDHGVLGAMLAIPLLFVSPTAALIVWLCSPLYSAACWIGAVLRGGHVYRDAEHERSAYGQVASGWDRPWRG